MQYDRAAWTAGLSLDSAGSGSRLEALCDHSGLRAPQDEQTSRRQLRERGTSASWCKTQELLAPSRPYTGTCLATGRAGRVMRSGQVREAVDK